MPDKLPAVAKVASWTSEHYVAALRHDQHCTDYNPHFRQLIHFGFKVAAELGIRYTDALKAHAEIVSSNVTNNLLEKHTKPIFG